MNSMTGFGRGTATVEGYTVIVELSSVNRRTLELTTTLSKEFQALDRLVTEKLRSAFQRGKIHASVQMSDNQNNYGLAPVAQVLANLEYLQQLAAAARVEFVVTPELLFRLASMTGGTQAEVLSHRWEPPLQLALDQAIAALQTMRKTEGQALRIDLANRIDQLQQIVAKVRQQSTDTVTNYRELLLQRLRLAGLEIDLSDERVLKELALFADRCDITEELTRMESHLHQFRESLDRSEENWGDPIGRKLEFLTQEIGREINTIGAKANSLTITQAVLQAKNEIERIREQLANVE